MKYCKKCGVLLNDDARFCYHCGASQEHETNTNYENSPYVYVPNQKQAVEQNKYNGNTLGVISVCIGGYIPIIGIICGIFAVSSGIKVVNKQAIIFGTIGTVLSVVAWIINIIALFNIN